MDSTSQNKCTLLYVDDDEDTLVLMAEVFSLENYNVVTKLSGEEGLKYIEENGPVTAVISDFVMKGMNGLEFLKQVKAHFPTTKLCLCTGSFDEGALEDKVKNQELDGYIIKPSTITSIFTTVTKLMEVQESRTIILPLKESAVKNPNKVSD